LNPILCNPWIGNRSSNRPRSSNPCDRNRNYFRDRTYRTSGGNSSKSNRPCADRNGPHRTSGLNSVLCNLWVSDYRPYRARRADAGKRDDNRLPRKRRKRRFGECGDSEHWLHDELPRRPYQVVAKRINAVVVVFAGIVKVNVPAVTVCEPKVWTLTALFVWVLL
jgi:hypothetical protein